MLKSTNLHSFLSLDGPNPLNSLKHSNFKKVDKCLVRFYPPFMYALSNMGDPLVTKAGDSNFIFLQFNHVPCHLTQRLWQKQDVNRKLYSNSKKREISRCKVTLQQWPYPAP